MGIVVRAKYACVRVAHANGWLPFVDTKIIHSYLQYQERLLDKDLLYWKPSIGCHLENFYVFAADHERDVYPTEAVSGTGIL